VGSRFADDVFLFARTAGERMFLMNMFVHEFAEIGLVLNPTKTIVSTNEAQPPTVLTMRRRQLQVKIELDERKWLARLYFVLGTGWEN